MAGYAALIDRVDQELGRLVADLEKAGELDNTLILFLSDNGACPYDRQNIGVDLQPYGPRARWTDSTGWAWARNTPFRFYKQNQFEGGIATPAIVHWPAGLKTKPGTINATPAHLVDVLPTIAEDRSELHDLAAKHPERVKSMAAEWHRMAKDDLKATAREQRPVASASETKTHPEWSDYSGKNGAKPPVETQQVPGRRFLPESEIARGCDFVTRVATPAHQGAAFPGTAGAMSW